MPNDLELSDYEVSLLNAFNETCEELGDACIHDFQLRLVRGFEKSSVILADMFGRLSSRGFLEQNQFKTNGIPTNWWRMTALGAAAIADSTLTRRPRPHSSSAPNWVSRLQDPELRNVLVEVYDARENGYLVLSLIGARTAFDRAMYLKVGDPKGGFGGKLSAMKARALIDDRSIDILGPMIDAGNAAAHRGMIPTSDVLNAVINELQRQLHDWFVRDGDASIVRQATPKRPR